MKRFSLFFLAILACLASIVVQAAVPRDAYQYQNELTRQARFYWGITAPVATFAGQIHQESAWRATARSRYASGLAQFMPATAEWIAGAYPRELGENAPLNPAWAIRALVIYDLHLWSRLAGAASSCDRMAMTLAAYNGGAGHISKERRLAEAGGADPGRWFGHVAEYCRRADWACAENRAYPRLILLKWQPAYAGAGWGTGVTCT